MFIIRPLSFEILIQNSPQTANKTYNSLGKPFILNKTDSIRMPHHHGDIISKIQKGQPSDMC